MLSPTERFYRARIGAFSLHAQRDPRETTKAARQAFLDRFATDVDPNGELSEEERLRRGQAALSAHMSRIALRRAKLRRQRAAQSGGTK